MIQQEYHTYHYKKKIDQVYQNYLSYWPEFLWPYRNPSLSWESLKEQFYQDMEEYYIDINNKKIYRWDSVTHYSDTTLMTWVDYDTFTPVWGFYARDKNYLYYNGKKTNFDLSLHPRLLGQFIIDDRNVYTEDGVLLTGADPKSFQNIVDTNTNMGSSYYKDMTNVYIPWWTLLSWVDLESFEVIGMYAKDKNHVYIFDNIIQWVDPITFKLFDDSSSYAKDKDNIFIGSRIITWADMETFEIIDMNKAKDKNHVYDNGKIVE